MNGKVERLTRSGNLETRKIQDFLERER